LHLKQGARDRLSPKKENPFHLAFRAREGGCHQRGCCQRKRTPLHLAFRAREGVVSRENRTQLHLMFGVREGVVTRENETHSVSCLKQGSGLLPEKENPLYLAFEAREGLSPEKENPLHLMFKVREGLLSKG